MHFSACLQLLPSSLPHVRWHWWTGGITLSPAMLCPLCHLAAWGLRPVVLPALHGVPAGSLLPLLEPQMMRAPCHAVHALPAVLCR